MVKFHVTQRKGQQQYGELGNPPGTSIYLEPKRPFFCLEKALFSGVDLQKRDHLGSRYKWHFFQIDAWWTKSLVTGNGWLEITSAIHVKSWYRDFFRFQELTFDEFPDNLGAMRSAWSAF